MRQTNLFYIARPARAYTLTSIGLHESIAIAEDFSFIVGNKSELLFSSR